MQGLDKPTLASSNLITSTNTAPLNVYYCSDSSMKKSVYYPSCRNKYQCRLPFLVGSNNQSDYHNANNTENAISSTEENETVPLSSNRAESILKVENDDNNIDLDVNADDLKGT